jgi:hypothetical protein
MTHPSTFGPAPTRCRSLRTGAPAERLDADSRRPKFDHACTTCGYHHNEPTYPDPLQRVR